jgi:hypothetical protein
MALQSPWEQDQQDPWGANTGGNYQTGADPWGADLQATYDKTINPSPTFDPSQATPRTGQRGTSPEGGAGVGGWSDADSAALNSSYEQFLGRSAGPDDFAAHQANPGGLQGAQQAVQQSPEARGYARVSEYQRQVADLGSTTDPQQRAMKQDQLARQVYSDLQGAGHQVKWDGDTLVVDGRRYTVGAPQATAGGGGTQPYSDSAVQSILHKYPPTNDGMRQAMAEIDRVFGPGTVKLLEHPDRLDKLVLPDGRTIDTIIGAGGANPSWGWLTEGGHSGGGGGGGGYAPAAFSLPAGAGVGGASSINPGARPTTPTLPDWTPEATGYTPGAIPTDDLPSASYEALLGQMGGYTPTPVQAGYQFGGFENMDADTEAATQALIQQLLANPESLDARTVDMLKGASREEQAQQAQMLDEDLIGLGYGMGIDSSPWLASERLNARRDRDEAISRGNRTIDIEAARTNMGDRQAAANIGAAYGDAVSRRRLAEAQAGEANKQTASAQALQAALANEQNVFNAAQLQSNNVVNAAKLQIDQAAAATDRLALREASAQAAAELGISRDKLMLDWVTSKMGELVDLYDIDLSAYLDLTQLATANTEFKDDLAFRLLALQQQMELSHAQLREGGRQFDVGAGIDLARLQEQARQFGINSQFRAYGL